ncbi:hypothetical protein ACFXTO_025640 [Malus domestica]
MSDSKLLVFGSFSEDETRSLLLKQSPVKAEKPVEKNVLQFGSINFVSAKSSVQFNDESSGQKSSLKASTKLQPLSSFKQDEVKAVKAVDGNLPASSATPAENGCTDNYVNCSAHSNGVEEEMRTHEVSKVGYPTLSAFAEFVSEFDMPSGSSSKDRDVSVLETGRPFSPAMFEGVLKNFTPDVRTSISGRQYSRHARGSFSKWVCREIRRSTSTTSEASPPTNTIQAYLPLFRPTTCRSSDSSTSKSYHSCLPATPSCSSPSIHQHSGSSCTKVHNHHHMQLSGYIRHGSCTGTCSWTSSTPSLPRPNVFLCTSAMAAAFE